MTAFIYFKEVINIARISKAELDKLMLLNPEMKKAVQQQLKSEKKKENKYKNHRVYVYSDGVYLERQNRDEKPDIFDSEKEYRRYGELKMLEKAGKITKLTRQRVLVIQEKSKYQGATLSAIKYKADFSYFENGREVVEDVKGFNKTTQKHITTEAFNLKWKLLKFKYPDVVFRIY